MTGPHPVVRDEHGRVLPLVRRLGAGGQATVWASEGRIAVKLMHARTQRGARRLRSRFEVVRRLKLDNVPVSRPLNMLVAPDVGYSMELLEDMVAIQTLAASPPDQDLLEWYAETGGLRRRLRLLARAADAFASLHANGVVYADPSPANVLISDSTQHEEVRLVDVDFLQSESVVLDTAGTPGYAAPELLTGQSGVTNASDAYAFAVIAFQVLTLVHPFLGDEVLDGEPELEEKAYSGQLPWIDHTDDTSNRTRYGLPRDRVLSSGLRDLAKQVFQDGLANPRRRPAIAQWRSELLAAADMVLACTGCRQSNDVRLSACPWCGAPAPGPLIGLVHFILPDMPEPVSAREALAIPPGGWLPVTTRTAHLNTSEYDPRPVAWLLWKPGDSLTVRNNGPAPLWLSPERDPGNLLAVEPAEELAVPSDASAPRWVVRFGPPNDAHRFLRFRRVRRRQAES